jgi:acylphosphatase
MIQSGPQRMKTRVHIFVSGRVQGVAYRYFARDRAITLLLTGWVRNLNDGRVEVLAEGETESIERFLAELRRGPRLARVDQVEVSREVPSGEYAEFAIGFDAY